MKIRHERPMSDLALSVRAPLGLELMTGERLTIESWSLTGFTFPGESELLPREAILSIPFQGVDIRFPVRLARQGVTRFLAFDGLSGRQRETLAVFYRSLLSGRMAATDDVITSLDTPVDLVPMEETAEEEAAGRATVAPRPLRAALTVLGYLVIAGVVLATLGQGVVSRLATVDIRNARIEAPLTQILALQPGYVADILVAPGAEVAAGDLLVRVVTPETEAGLTDVRGRIAMLERRLDAVRTDHAAVADWIAREREALSGAIRMATDAAVRRRAEAERAAFEGRTSPDHAALFETEAGLLLEIADLEQELRRLRRERGRLRGAADALHLIASAPGHVTAVMVQEGQFLARGIPAVEIEGAEARVARGWIGQDMAAALAPGMATDVTVNDGTGPARLEGRISAVVAGIDPELSPEFGMLVTVDFPELTLGQTRERLPHLMPVAVEARRPWARRLGAFVAGLFRDWS
ncbi:HlyD family efflux transporter periplasmic adaptor subunit [Jannaschia marina]|uniref:HlyD family efflux transporter periplasmic adaptor subunit n=1 Tax=Jannaschia marina TaxID=2741674 RepID=UPI0015C8FA06|nr:HlyD family secretion protein [Jannaschia marina]